MDRHAQQKRKANAVAYATVCLQQKMWRAWFLWFRDHKQHRTKAAVALCAHVLIDKGLLNSQEKVTKYWPEYGKNGKEDTTVEMLLNHSAGLPALKTKVKDDGFLDLSDQ